MQMNRDDFWAEVKRRTKEEDSDEILVYMHLMLEKARRRGRMLLRICFGNMVGMPHSFPVLTVSAGLSG
jgi:hypothetical protein